MDGTDIREILAKNIKFFRENRRWSQADLASFSDISIPFLSEIERGNKWPYPDTLAKIVKALDIKIYDLFREESQADENHGLPTMVIKEILIAQKEATDSVLKGYFNQK